MAKQHEKELYFRSVTKRQIGLKQLLLGTFSTLSYPYRIILEVFLRRNLGERHFSLTWAIGFGILLTVFPFFSKLNSYHMDVWETVKDAWLWYVFLAAYFVCVYFRSNEIKRLPSVFDFERYSLSDGKLLPFFSQLKINGEKFNIRTTETLLEPALVLAAGIVSFLVSQALLGAFLILGAVVYAFSKSLDYMQGDEYIMDMIDNMIVNRDMTASFVFEKETESGFRFKGKRPNALEDRETMVNEMIEQDDVSEVI